jgi:hypothetical protein
MNLTNEKPRIHVKAKNMQQVLDFCIERKTEFTVIPRHSNDDWEIELSIKSIKEAITWGMFLKTCKIELIENPLFAPAENTVNVKQKTTARQKTAKKTPATQENKETASETPVPEEKKHLSANKVKNKESNEHQTNLPFDENQKNSNELF